MLLRMSLLVLKVLPSEECLTNNAFLVEITSKPYNDNSEDNSVLASDNLSSHGRATELLYWNS